VPHLHRQEWPEEEGDATAVSHKCRRAGLGQNVHHSAGEVGRRRRSAAHAVDVEAQQLVAPPWSTVPLTQHTMTCSDVGTGLLAVSVPSGRPARPPLDDKLRRAEQELLERPGRGCLALVVSLSGLFMVRPFF